MAFRILSAVVVSTLLISGAFAFAPGVVSRGSSSNTQTALYAASNDRRSFLNGAFVGAAAAATSGISPAFADGDTFDDLSMPTEQEAKKDEDEAMKAKIARKAELQKQMARPMRFEDSLKAEKERQQGLKGKTKEELREAMCEELGRGC